MKSTHFLVVSSLGLLICAPIAAQTPANAGSLNQQIKRERPVESAPTLHIEQVSSTSTPTAGQQKNLLKSLRIAGARAYNGEQLLAVTGFSDERELTLGQLLGFVDTGRVNLNTPPWDSGSYYRPLHGTGG